MSFVLEKSGIGGRAPRSAIGTLEMVRSSGDVTLLAAVCCATLPNPLVGAGGRPPSAETGAVAGGVGEGGEGGGVGEGGEGGTLKLSLAHADGTSACRRVLCMSCSWQPALRRREMGGRRPREEASDRDEPERDESADRDESDREECERDECFLSSRCPIA